MFGDTPASRHFYCLIVLISIALGLLFGCGPDRAQTIVPVTTGEANETSSVVDESTEGAAAAIVTDKDRDNVIAALLTLDDMPTGWTQNETAVFTPSTPGGTYRSMCQDIPARSIGSASVSFSQSTLGPQVDQFITIYPSSEEAEAAMADLSGVAQECGEYSDDNGNVFTLSPLAFPSLGDDTFAVRSANQLVQADWVRIRVDSAIINLIQAGLSINSELTEELARLAVDRYNEH